MLHRSRTLAVVMFVLGVAACGAPPAPAPPAAAEAEGASGAPASTSTAPGSAARKRTRTHAAAPPARDGTKPKNGRTLNPRDPQGRTVFVRGDDQCFVEVPGGTLPDGTAARATEVVDCPPEADDPAWDHCAAQIVVDDGGKCFCVTGAGHPRPMPNPTPCPGSR